MCEKTVAEKIVDYVEQHLEEELSLDKIAKKTGFITQRGQELR